MGDATLTGSFRIYVKESVQSQNISRPYSKIHYICNIMLRLNYILSRATAQIFVFIFIYIDICFRSLVVYIFNVNYILECLYNYFKYNYFIISFFSWINYLKPYVFGISYYIFILLYLYLVIKQINIFMKKYILKLFCV